MDMINSQLFGKTKRTMLQVFFLVQFARVRKKRLICQESIKSDQSVAVMEIEPKSGSDIEDKRQGFL